MRRIIMMNRISLDGYYTRQNREIDWFIHDPEVDIAAHGMMQPDTLLMGRHTYEMFESAWRPVLENPTADSHSLMLARELAELKKIVFTQTLETVSWENSTIATDDVVTTARKLKQDEGADIGLFGSGEIAKLLMQNVLIDDLILVVTPIILGNGKSFFADLQQTSLELLDSQYFNSGNIIMHYRRI